MSKEACQQRVPLCKTTRLNWDNGSEISGRASSFRPGISTLRSRLWTQRGPLPTDGEWPSSSARRAAREKTVLLDGDLRAGSLELLLGGVGRVLGNLLQDGLRSTLDEVLGFLQAEAGNDLTDDLDDLDLLVAGRLEDDVELVLLLSSLGGSRCLPAAATATGAAAVTSKVSSNAFTNSESSRRVSSLNWSNNSSVLSFAIVAVLPVSPMSLIRDRAGL